MKHAIKINNSPVLAYELGAGSCMEQLLLKNGAIKLSPDGTYELFSREAVNGAGEKARFGDYFKCDKANGKYYAYPIQREYFLSHYTHLFGDNYQQNSIPLPVWHMGDPDCLEMDFLLSHGLITINENDPDRYFNAYLHDAMLSASSNAAVVFYEVDYSDGGSIQKVIFNFVAHDYFEKNYQYC